MRFSLSEEQEALRRQARQLLAKQSGSAAVRAAMETERGFAPELWAQLVELGWTALLVPEAAGGLGLGWVELAAVLEEAGAALLCAPLFSTVALATNALLLVEGDAAHGALGDIAGGTRAALVWGDGLTAQAGSLSGQAEGVIDGHTAELLVVIAAGGVYLVPAEARGVTRRLRQTLDPTRKLADVQFAGVTATRLPGDGAAILGRALERARIALAAEQLGGAERCLALSVEYAKTRVQFGRAIGSFQAIKHHCADMLVLVESARSATWWAAWCAATGDGELSLAAGLAHSYAADAYLRVAGQTIQVHGGMGFTWEHDAHLHLRRARGGATLLGDPRHERAALATRLGL